MKKFIIILAAGFCLQSCVVNTAAKAVTAVAKAGYGVVKGTVKGISWTVNKAKGKIDEDRLDGDWKLVGIYDGPLAEYEREKNPNTSFEATCANENTLLSFKTKKSKLKQLYCAKEKVDFEKYKFQFGRNSATGDKENYITFANKNLTIVDVSNKNLVLEGVGFYDLTKSNRQVYLFEKK